MSATEYKQPTSVLIPISFAKGQIIKEIDTAHCLNALYLTKEGVMSHQTVTKVVMPVLTPDRLKKRQNGRRFKDNGEEAFTLTAQDIHGVAISVSGNEVSESENVSRCLNANDQRKVFGANQTRTMAEVPIKEATKKGYALAHEGDSINLAMPESQTRRGRVGGGVAQTLDTSCNQGVIVTKGSIPSDNHDSIYVEIYPGCMVYAVWYEKYQCYIAIRKLTPRECFRLQGWDDVYFERAEFVNSDSQLYKQAGNGVTVNVVYDIASKISVTKKQNCTTIN